MSFFPEFTVLFPLAAAALLFCDPFPAACAGVENRIYCVCSPAFLSPTYWGDKLCPRAKANAANITLSFGKLIIAVHLEGNHLRAEHNSCWLIRLDARVFKLGSKDFHLSLIR